MGERRERRSQSTQPMARRSRSWPPTLAAHPRHRRAGRRIYPDRPVKIIVPTPPGGPVDVIARIIANYLQGRLGRAFVVENRAGAGNTIGSKDAAEAVPDGYTLLYSGRERADHRAAVAS